MKLLATTVLFILSFVYTTFGTDKVGDSKVRIGILDLVSYGDNKDLADKATSDLNVTIRDIGFYDVFSQDMLNTELKKTGDRMPYHCRDPKSVLDVGRSTQMNRMLYGTIDFTSKQIGLKLTLIDVTMKQTISTVNICGDPGTAAQDVIKAAVAKLHGNQNVDNSKFENYYGPQVHNEKKFLWSTAGFLGAGVIWGLLNYYIKPNDGNKLKGDYKDEDLFGVPASADQIPMFARPSALANAYTAVSDDAYGVLYNPAGVAWVAGQEFGAAYQYRFGLNNISLSYVNKATREIGFGQTLLFSSDADDIMREIYFVTAIAYKFNDLISFMRPFSVGVNVKIASNRVNGSEEGSVSGASFGAGIDLGLLFELTEKIRYGLTLRDLPVVNSWKNVTTGEQYFEANATTLHMGGSFQAGYTTFLVADGQLPLNKDQSWKMAGGIEQELFHVILLRAGMSKEIESTHETPWKITGGFGLKFYKVNLDGSYEYNTSEVFNVVNVSLKIGF